MRLSGPGGLSRSYAIHEKLWNYLRGMIERIVWGQEQFGSGFGGPHKQHADDANDTADAYADANDVVQTSSTAPWRGLRKGSLRTLGTVESLMLLTEWHPRALHFPPGDDGDELVVSDGSGGGWHDAGEPAAAAATHMPAAAASGAAPNQRPPQKRGIGGKRIESWLEPAWRSDRMSWMLLGNALALSFELGVFDAMDPDSGRGSGGGGRSRPENQSPAYRARAKRLRQLVLVYLTQLSGRLDWPNPCDGNILANLKLPAHRHGQTSGGCGDNGNAGAATGVAVSVEDTIVHCWIEVTSLMQRGNELLFPTREHTRELIRSGRYTTLLEQFQPLLRDCRKDIDRLHREHSSPALFRFPYPPIVLLRPVVRIRIRFMTHESVYSFLF
jgi:hypothetical protein